MLLKDMQNKIDQLCEQVTSVEIYDGEERERERESTH